jgi:hypothetical protein
VSGELKSAATAIGAITTHENQNINSGKRLNSVELFISPSRSLMLARHQTLENGVSSQHCRELFPTGWMWDD